ncbi:polymerase [Melao virus]|uniref:RNA-directed RNA polymerase L n=2 Tax=Melao virus TaxID=35515 RepID=A0A1I9WAJ4_9VIRU|nr:polymerase [Melao virus]APA28993.1 polymerase [Melao virus]QIM41040.1 RNA-dependent RNA polymerase [Melao virus]QIM58238.1 RNA-dependent RNA polymerase [Melao virus]QIM58239.1 RNA-dependent RNA polymerase [Melao virus]QIM58240.1 RNA-dependent RNA polymerase [Melao virus]
MDRAEYQQFLARINAAKDACVAKDIDVDLLMSRHDYFGKELCKSLNIEYRNDVPFIDIILDIRPDVDPLTIDAPHITPDNYLYINNILYIIDYKVSVSNESSIITNTKYYELTRDISDKLNLYIEIVIIRIDPITRELYISSDRFKDMYPTLVVDINFNQYFDLKQMLYEKFGDDDEFLLKVAHGDFTLTAPWCKTGCPEVWQHKIYKEFKMSMPIPERRLFEESMKFNSYESERWNTNLIKIREYTKKDYQEFVTNSAREVFLATGDFKQPNKKEINEGWDLMVQRVSSQRDVSKSVHDQKPSIHFIWSTHNPNNSNNATFKLILLSKSLQSIKGNSTYSEAFKSLGRMMDIGDRMSEYESFCEGLKQQARSTWKQVMNKKLEPKRINESLVLWEQQFMINTDVISKTDKIKLFRDFCGIGKHKQFKNKMLEDIDISKPKILDFNDETIYLTSLTMMEQTKLILSEKSGLKTNNFILDEFGSKIKDCNKDTFDIMAAIFETRFWQCISDFSTLMKNILSVSQYNRHNTFRIAMCANNNVFALVYPSADIKTKKATVVYSIIVLHKDETCIFNPGSLHATFKCSNGFISISRAIRLDKERCQRIVSSPGLFLTTCLLFKHENPTIRLDDIMTFSIYTSLSITKSVLSLTEPSRYMIMNSLAISSNVKDYIAEKFSPYTKTLFSVYMTRLIKNACFDAYNQRKKVQLRDIYLSDYDITQKGIKDNRELTSIWFPGSVTLKEYLTQIYLPFYFNAKGLHEKHHVMVDLAKTILEIEDEQRKNIIDIWSSNCKKQTVNLKILVHSLCKNLLADTSRHNHLRNRIENRNNFRRSITTISTFTSSKSCIKIGNFQKEKEIQLSRQKKTIEIESRKRRLANPIFVSDEEISLEIGHCNYNMLREAMPEYVDYMSTKVFDRLFELLDTNQVDDKPTIEMIMDMMVNHKDFYFTFFNKGQKTSKDREIFVGEYEAKMCMYAVERIAKERCKLNPDEMISEPGDGKLRVLEQKSEQEIRFLVETTRQRNRDIDEEIEQLAADGFEENIVKIEKLARGKARGLKMEINADMSKWSAQDVFFKYFWLIALDPILYPQEKERILYFLCNYMDKKLILPDELLFNLMDQKIAYKEDIISTLTNQLRSNTVQIKRNWLQGNFNYTSSYVHSCAMSVYKDILKEAMSFLEGSILVNSLVHSDDNQTSVTIVQDKVPDEVLIEFAIKEFEKVCLTFGCQANMKKTYVTNCIKEFVSLFNLYGEPFSIYGRFLLTSVGDCAYIGPYEDLASRISSAQTAIKHGCPPSLAWVSIAISHWMTALTYNMLPGQSNDPLDYFPAESRKEIPIELNGVLDAPLSMISTVGLEAGNLYFLIKLLNKYTPIMQKRESVVNQIAEVRNWDVNVLDENELFRLKILRYLVLDAEMDPSDIMGETSDMRGRSILTPRKFTTAGSLRKLYSFNKYQDRLASPGGMNELFTYLLAKPELLVTKGEDKTDYMESVVFRYNSKRFKESLSIQNPAQLFIEQILFSHKPVIDFSGIRDKYINLHDSRALEKEPDIIGKVTFTDAYRILMRDLNSLPLTNDDIQVIYSYIILNDPLMITIANTNILSIYGSPQKRTGMSCSTMPEFRNLKLIHHSPALVLRAYSKNNPDVQGADPTEMARDLVHLKDFVANTNLEEKMKQRIKKNEDEKGARDIIFELKEMTRFYQVCYEYIKSTEHKIKVFILPAKAYTTTDFCSLMQGNLIKDREWYTVHYLKQILSGGHKAIMQHNATSEQNIAFECFRLITHFADSFIDASSRGAFLRLILDSFSYKDVKVSKLYEIIRSGHNRTDFIPLLFRTGDLNQHDLDRYDAMKSQERVTWNDWQTSRHLDMGAINLTISGHNRSITIIGEDNKLTYSELNITKNTPENVTISGRNLLKSRHGLKFENMSRVTTFPGSYYITYRRKDRHQFVYQIHSHESIIRRNEEHLAIKPRLFNEIVPVCLVNVAEVEGDQRILIRSLDYLNNDVFTLSRIKVGLEEYAVIKKAHFSKMVSFDGPPIKTGLLNLTELMKSQDLLNLNYDNIRNSNLISFSKIICCEGSDNIDDGLEFLSDDPMTFTEGEAIHATPIFNIFYSKKGEKHMTYRNAIKLLIERETANFEEAFTFHNDGFLSPENLGCLEGIVSLIRVLKTNEWSTVIDKCIHICLIKNNMDYVYHKFDIPSCFYENPITRNINWMMYRDFILTLPKTYVAPWNIMLEHFRAKCTALILDKMETQRDFSEFAKLMRRKEGKTNLDFN